MSRGHATIQMDGQVFGFLTVVRRAGSDRFRGGKKRYATWVCRCTCGQEVVVRGQHLRRGLRKACARNGHFFKDSARGLVQRYRAEYRTWRGMKKRCADKKDPDYGGRGIQVCERWRSFSNFVADMGHRPSSEHTIERDDVNGDYTPANCRWLPSKDQARNTRRSVYIEFDGERMLLLDMTAKLGLSTPTVYARLKLGWSLEAAITTPIRRYRKKDRRVRRHAKILL